MANLNYIQRIGRLAGEVTLRQTTTGKLVAEFTVVSNEGRNPEYLKCVQFGTGAEHTANNAAQGRSILVRGSMISRTIESNKFFDMGPIQDWLENSEYEAIDKERLAELVASCEEHRYTEVKCLVGGVKDPIMWLDARPQNAGRRTIREV